MKPLGALGIIIAVVLSLIATVPNLVHAQTPASNPAAGTTGSTTPSNTTSTSSPKDGTLKKDDGTAVTPSSAAPGLTGPTFPHIDFPTFQGPTTAGALNTTGLLDGSFAACVEKQFGLRFQFLPAIVQTEILKSYGRFSVPGKCLNSTAPAPVDPGTYGVWLLGGSIALVFAFTLISRETGFLNEVIPLPAPAPLSADAINTIMTNVQTRAAAAGNWTQDVYNTELKSAFESANPPRMEYAFKFSISRLIALIGTYVILVTFAFAARYGFWALFYLGDNTVFEKITSAILAGGLAAFAPYIVNKVSDAIKPTTK